MWIIKYVLIDIVEYVCVYLFDRTFWSTRPSNNNESLSFSEETILILNCLSLSKYGVLYDHINLAEFVFSGPFQSFPF